MLRRKYVVFVIDAPELEGPGFVLAVHRSIAKAERKAYEFSVYGSVGMMPTSEPVRFGDFVKIPDTCPEKVIRVSLDF